MYALAFLVIASEGEVLPSALAALWYCSPVLWWAGYAWRCGRGTSNHRFAVLMVGVPVFAVLGVFLKLIATSDSSTAPAGYLFVPFFVLILTMLGTAISGFAVARSNRADERAAETHLHL